MPDAMSVSETFSQGEFTAALLDLKLGKAPDPYSIFQEFIIHGGAT